MAEIIIKCTGTDVIPFRQLKDFQGELKTITDDNLDKLKNSIIKNGFCAPVFVWKNKDKNYLIDGHQRLKALNSLFADGYTIPDIPIVYITADNKKDAKRKLLYISSQYGQFTIDGYADFALDIDVDFNDLRLTDGLFDFSMTDDKTEAVEDDYEIPDEIETDIKLGDLFQIGQHRLLCGDSTDAEQVARLMGGEKADMVLTDPPYNVDYTGKTKDALKIKNDKKTDEAFYTFLYDFYITTQGITKSGGAWYIWHADSEGHNFRKAMNDSGVKVRQCLVWVKNSLVMGRQDYHWQHEPCLYGWKDGASHGWYADRKQTTVLRFDRPTRSKEHPTMKPIALFAYQIGNSSKKEELIYDGFLGSGSTMVASHQLNRKCYGMELDPKYCQVIIDRMKALDPNIIIRKCE